MNEWDELVSKQTVIDEINKWLNNFLEDRRDLSDVIKQLPPVKSKQRTGKWIPSDSQCGIRCSVCGVSVDDFCHSIDYIDLDYEPNFCPNCGWPMKGDAE